MRHNPAHAVTDEAIVRELIVENPWATLVSHGESGMVASHYPVLLYEESPGLAVLTHVGRPDDQVHRFGADEMLMIIAGPHGYISPSWYREGEPPVPTWNFSTVHCYGMPEVLDADENLRVLTRLVEHFERHVEQPVYLDQEIGARIARGTVGIRLPITRFICKVKMSANKDAQTQRQVVAALRGSGPYAHPALADEMERALSRAARPTESQPGTAP